MSNYLAPSWAAPRGIRAVSTLRTGGCSRAPFDSFNLASHVGDDPQSVRRNRELLRRDLKLPGEPHWLSQVHGTNVVYLPDAPGHPTADAAWTDRPGQVCAVLTADCLPVLLAARDGSRIAAAHAGWRGLAAGVLEATVRAMGVPGSELLAWIGPGIEQKHFEVGGEVREAFTKADAGTADAFSSLGRDQWLADLYLLARRRLDAVGVRDVQGGGRGTFGERQDFFSHRRDGRCGRMATLVWKE